MNLEAILFSFTHKILLENSIIARCQKLKRIFSKNISIFKVLLHEIFQDIENFIPPKIKNHMFLKRFHKKHNIFSSYKSISFIKHVF